MIENLYSPAFYDNFGFLAFVFILGLAIWMLNHPKKPAPKWATILLFVIGLLGLLVDWIIVYYNYIN